MNAGKSAMFEASRILQFQQKSGNWRKFWQSAIVILTLAQSETSANYIEQKEYGDGKLRWNSLRHGPDH
jgi:hypothetical protein